MARLLTFNVADISIVVGGILLLFLYRRREEVSE